MAQFINPTTPDEVASCTSSSVANTGTSASGDLQVVVVDGEMLLSKDMRGVAATSQLDLNHLPYGIYSLSVHYQNAAPEYKRIVIAK